MAQKLDLKIRGLFTNPNNLSEVPDGALSVADNVVIDKESVVESRRGQAAYGNALSTGSGQINKIFNYRNSLITHYNNKLAYDSDNSGNWVEYPGTYVEPTAQFRMRSLEANRNFYFTTSQGIFKLDEIDSTPRSAGAPKGLDGVGSVTGSSGFMSDDTAIAYRIVWGYRDANNNLIIGAPSQRVIVTNSSGGTRNTDLTFTIPSNVDSTYIYQIYRSGESASASDVPNDELQLVIEDNPTTAEISARSFNVTDATPNDLKGAFLYTNPSQQGIANANEVPPFAKDMDVYKDHTFYANVRSKQRFSFTIISVDSPSFGFITDAACATTSGDATITVADSSDMRVGMRIVGSGIPSDTFIESITNGTTIEATNAATTTAGTVSLEFQDRLSIDAVDYFAGSSTIVADNQFKVFTAATLAENIANTSLELIEVINKSASNTTLYAYYLSGFTDLPGQILVEERLLGGDNFAVTSTAGESFNPVLPERKTITSNTDADPTVITSNAHGLSNGDRITIYNSNSTPSINGTYTVSDVTTNTFTIPVEVTSAGTQGFFNISSNYVDSDNNERQNRVYISKAKQPEAVPLGNFIDIGSADAPIKRIVALRDSVFVFKNDGIFRITGEGIASFRVSLFDNSVVIKAPESAVSFNNQVFTFSDQGITAVSDNGVAVVSRPIESTLLELSSDQFTNFESASFGVSYESNRQYIFYTVTNTFDTHATQAFVYNSFTSSWTRWQMDRTCAVVSRRDNKLYLGEPTNDSIYKERKNFDITDYADEKFDITITGFTDTTVNVDDTTGLAVGMTLKQGSKEVIIEAIPSGTSLTVSRVFLWDEAAAEVFKPIATQVKWIPTDFENPGILKQFRELTLFFRDASFNYVDVGFDSNFSTFSQSVRVNARARANWGDFPWGNDAWGGGIGGQQAIRTFVPVEKQRASWVNVSVSVAQAFTNFSLAGVSYVFNPMSEKFR